MKSARERMILAIAIIGIVLSAYAITLHYQSGPSKLCDINDTFNCDTVNKSSYSELFDIPVAILGLLSYLGVFLAVLMRKRIQRALAFTAKDFAQYFLIVVVIMFLFQVYLTAVEIFIIQAYCLVCLLSQTLLILLLWMAWLEFSSPVR